MSRVTIERTGGCDRKFVWGRKDEEYVADFCLVSRRVLNEEEHRVFKFHFLLGADWKLCCRQLKMDRGTFFHTVYRIERRLGREFRELRPYSLYPLDEYFNGAARREPVTPSHPPAQVLPIPVRPVMQAHQPPVSLAA